ncbi:hypothetical protein VNO77_17389 [Canavalia gladiata]|uniref:C2H2-type domain-containing protein n=1 Tax=Canavalia gladiata TaxID=3824 RepID=A0AAN9LIZ4_CANGL
MEGNYLSRKTHKGDSFGFEEHKWGTSWPARNYGCSFCKREFKSAQALGGHMNVHRRDRANMRSSLSSWVSECPKPNPTHASPSSPSSSSLSDKVLNYAHGSPLCSPCLTLSSSASLSGDKKPKLPFSQQLPLLSLQSSREIEMTNNIRSGLGVEELQGCAMREEFKLCKNNCEHNIKLELGIGLLKHPKEKLDLELRLGH